MTYLTKGWLEPGKQENIFSKENHKSFFQKTLQCTVLYFSFNGALLEILVPCPKSKTG